MSVVNKVSRVDANGKNGAGLKSCNLIDPNDVISDAKPEETLGVYEELKGANLEVGVWTCSPCVEKVESFEISEFCVVAKGCIKLTDTDGNTESFTQGEAFVIEKGFSGTYEITEDLVKYFAAY